MAEHEARQGALDGNAAAGQFAGIFAVDVTTVMVTCAGCGEAAMFAQQTAFLGGPGTVLRCRDCDHLLARVARTATEQWLDLSGSSSWRIPADASAPLDQAAAPVSSTEG